MLAAVIAALLASSCLLSIRSSVTVLVSLPAVMTNVSSEHEKLAGTETRYIMYLVLIFSIFLSPGTP